jgi:hypothetical protein
MERDLRTSYLLGLCNIVATERLDTQRTREKQKLRLENHKVDH